MSSLLLAPPGRKGKPPPACTGGGLKNANFTTIPLGCVLIDITDYYYLYYGYDDR